MPSNRKTDKGSLASTASDQIRVIIEAAEQTAAQIRTAAEQEAAEIRRQAEAEATGIRSQTQSDVRDLLESIRDGVSRLSADVAQLEDKLVAVGPDDEAAKPVDETVPEYDTARAATSSEPTAQSGAPADADLESARLVALNMALDGASREDVDQYLSENFAVSDRKALLDDVYASVGG